MKTVICLENITNDEIVWNQLGTLTDVDISAIEGQGISFNGEDYIIAKIIFEMKSSGQNIDTVKHIHLQEEVNFYDGRQ